MDEYKQYYYSARPSAQGKAFGRFVFSVFWLLCLTVRQLHMCVEIMSLVELRVSVFSLAGLSNHNPSGIFLKDPSLFRHFQLSAFSQMDVKYIL